MTVLCLSSVAAFGQSANGKLRWGALIEYSMNIRPVASSMVADKFVISSSQSLDGYRAGVFGQITRGRGFWRSELAYFKGASFINYLNLKPEEDMVLYGHADYESSSENTHRNLELTLLRGFRIAGQLSAIGGLTCGLQFKQDLDGWLPDPTRPMDGAMYSLSENYNTFIFMTNIGANYQFGPLAVYLYWKPSLTSVTRGVDYEGVLYPVNYQLRIWSLGVNFFPLYKGE